MLDSPCKLAALSRAQRRPVDLDGAVAVFTDLEGEGAGELEAMRPVGISEADHPPG